MKNKNLLVVTIFLIVLFNSIVYSALNSEMFINGDAHIRVDNDVIKASSILTFKIKLTQINNELNQEVA